MVQKAKNASGESPPIAEGFMGIDRTFKKCREVLMAVVKIPSMVVELQAFRGPLPTVGLFDVLAFANLVNTKVPLSSSQASSPA